MGLTVSPIKSLASSDPPVSTAASLDVAPLTAPPGEGAPVQPLPPGAASAASAEKVFRYPTGPDQFVELHVRNHGETARTTYSGGVAQPAAPAKGAATVASSAAAASSYQTESVDPNDIFSPDTYNVDLDVYLAERGCSDVDSCSGGVRKSSGYTWFSALTVEVGDGPNTNMFGLHLGLALGGSGAKNTWYLDWSGYHGPASPKNGQALRVGGQSTGDTFKGHNVTNLKTGRWYRLRIWKVSCSSGEDTLTTGALTGWLGAVKDYTTGVEQQGGTWCLHSASMISHAYYFMEVIEPNPCTTDFWGTHRNNLVYRQPSGTWSFATATGYYVDSTCGTTTGNTNQRRTTGQYVIDERMTPRGSAGGVAWPSGRLW